MSRVFGSEFMSYTTHINYNQCKYRLYLMGDREIAKDQTLLFPPMVRGLYLHKLMEHWFLCDPVLDTKDGLEEIYAGIINPSRPDVDWGLRQIVWYPPYGEATFKDELLAEGEVFLKALSEASLPSGLSFEEIRVERLAICEEKWERQFEETNFVAHPDIVFSHPSSRLSVIADLKTGRPNKYSDQFLLYNWVVNGFYRYRPLPFYLFKWDSGVLGFDVVYHDLSPKSPELMRLLWELVAIHRRIQKAEQRIEAGEAPHRVLYPNTRNFTCHQHRCSFFSLCPYGQKKEVATDETGEQDI